MRQYCNHLNEQELIQQLKQGNEPAFRWLVENYRNRVFHTVLNILQDTKEAEDAAQETFIQVFESVGAFKEESSLNAPTDSKTCINVSCAASSASLVSCKMFSTV